MIHWLLFGLLLGSRLFAVDFSFDFRESHNLKDALKNPDRLPLLEDRGASGKTFYIENAFIEVIMPGGQRIETKSQALVVKTSPSGAVTVFKISGPIMPLGDVYEAGKKLYRAFSVPDERLEKWKSIANSEGSITKSVLDGNYADMYPPVYIDISHSMNNLYPWMISLSFGWNQIKDDKRDEAWGRENNPKPRPGLEIVSLEPPSGKTYDRADAWVEANRRQEKLDKRLGQVRGPDGQLITKSESLPKERSDRRLENHSERKSKKQDTQSSSPLQGLWWLLLFPITFIGAWLFLKGRSPQK